MLHIFVALLAWVGLSACSPADRRTPSLANPDSGTDPVDATPDAGADDLCEPTLVYPPELLAPCPDCSSARCVEGASLSAEERAGLIDCSPTHECLPDEYLLAGDAYVPPSCVGALGAEGRCLSICLPGVSEERDVLAQSTCPATHRCVPCFSPFDGSSTGACDAMCDPGPVADPVVLPTCCDGRAVCIDTDAVPAEAHRFYDRCTDEALCIPRPIVSTPGYVAARCTAIAIAETYGEEYGPGVCAHRCQAGIETLSAHLAQDDCDDDFVCVPCIDPATSEPSGACTAEQ
jgi:hypothetical protein